MMPAIVLWLIKRGWSEAAAKRIGVGIILAGIVALAVGLVFAGVGFTRYVLGLRDQTITQQGKLDQANVQIAAQQQNEDINGNEAVAREIDVQDIAAQQKERDDAIAMAPAGATGAATRAANCVRWSRQHPGSPTPAVCRRG